MTFHNLLPQHGLSRLAGWMTHIRANWFKNWQISWFVKRYNVDLNEAAQPDPLAYPHFNAFFTRELKPGARDVCTLGVASPADGTLSQFGRVTDGELLQAKGAHFSLRELLAEQQDWLDEFSKAQYATIYLSPRDYHRVHMPLTGQLTSMAYVPGQLFSVNDNAVQTVPRLFARNERVICHFITDHGPMLLILVGAMLVASVQTVWAGTVSPQKNRTVERWDYDDRQISLKKGDEMGRFQFGSTVIALFANEKLAWNDCMQQGNHLLFGQALATSRVGEAPPVTSETR